MRFKASLAAVAALMVSASAAHAGAIHTDWEKFKAGRALHHLSVDGQKALQDVLVARDLLAQGKTDAAIPRFTMRKKRFVAAQRITGGFMRRKTSAASPQHPVSATHKPTTGAVTWIPVGGEFILTETLAPIKAAAQQANQALKAGQNTQAQQNLQVVGEDADLLLPLAPLEQTKSTLYRARVLTEGRQAAQAKEALDQLLDSIVFVSDDFVDQSAGAPAPAKAAAQGGGAAVPAPASSPVAPAAAPAATSTPAAATPAATQTDSATGAAH